MQRWHVLGQPIIFKHMQQSGLDDQTQARIVGSELRVNLLCLHCQDQERQVCRFFSVSLR